MMIIDSIVERCFAGAQRYLKGKHALEIIQRILDPLLTLVITSHLFEKFYYHYTWIDITDYKAILNFIFKAQFIVPASLFVIVHIIVRVIAGALISPFKAVVRGLSNIFGGKNSKTKEILRKSLNKQHLNSTISLLNKMEPDIEQSFQFGVKILVTTIFFFIVQDHYGVALFLLMLIFSIGFLLAFGFLLSIIQLFNSMLKDVKNLSEISDKQESDQQENCS